MMPDICAYHPERAAVERCEVCGKPLCAYCLYYTEDGQRLCVMHAELARQIGVRIEEPRNYAEQLVNAQAGFRNQQHWESPQDRMLYKGNSNDLMALIAAVLGITVLASCCTGGYCLPLVGFLLSLVAVLNAKKAYDPSRTRKLGFIGMAFSGLFALIIIGVIALYGALISASFQTSVWNPSGGQLVQVTATTATPTLTPTPDGTIPAPQETIAP